MEMADQGSDRGPTRAVLRKVDVWSVLRVSAVFYVAVYCILLVAAVILWIAATATGLRDNIERVIADLIASGKFHFVGSELLRGGVVGGALLVVFGTAANAMLAVLYNLISDVVGGLSFVVEDRPSRRDRRRAGPAPDPLSAPPPAPTSREVPAAEPRPVAEPVVAAGTDTTTTTVLIPKVEQRESRPAPGPPADDRLAGTKQAADTNLEAFGL